MVQARKNRSLKKPTDSLKKYEKPLSLLIQTHQMTQTMNKDLPLNTLKKHQKSQMTQDDEQERQPKKVSKTTGCSDDEQRPAVKCIVMYSTEDEQEPTVKQPQKALKASEFVDDEQEPAVKCIVTYSTEDEQEPVVKQPQKPSPALVKPAKIPNFAAASCAYIITKGVRKGKQCKFRLSDETGKFCHHHKQTKPN